MTESWQRVIANVFPPQEVSPDGYRDLKVAGRFGVLWLPRRILTQGGEHVMPGNAVLPEHTGMVVTRGLQELACLLPSDLSFESAERLLGWRTAEEQVLSASTLRNLVRAHGALIRQTEQAEVTWLLGQRDLSSWKPQLAPHPTTRREAAWPAEVNAAVEAALSRPDPQPPKGVTSADWERVLTARREERERSVADLRRLGPEVSKGQILATVDEVLTRRPERRQFWELRTARVTTAAGYRYLSGMGDGFLQQLFVLLLVLGVGRRRSLLLLADGARWIQQFYTQTLAGITNKQMILDWYHLRHKGYQLSSLICRGKQAKSQFLATLYRHLWCGDLPAALEFLEAWRPQAKNVDKLDELIGYLQRRAEWIPNYGQRRRERLYIGSGHAEKANDLIVARRQKNKGMHWSQETSDALAALKTLMLNGGWDLYWQSRRVLPLATTQHNTFAR